MDWVVGGAMDLGGPCGVVDNPGINYRCLKLVVVAPPNPSPRVLI